MALIKTADEITLLRYSGSVVGKILCALRTAIQPKVTGNQLEKIALQMMRKHNCQPSFLNYRDFPKAICVSVNFEIIHGIPNDIPFRDGDLVSIDVGCQYQGYHADAALTVLIGEGTLQAQKLLATTQQCLTNVIQDLTPGKKVGWIGETIQKTAENAGFYLNNEYTGHGIGEQLHEDPPIYNKNKANKGIKLMPGMIICVEPMVLIGSETIETLADKWTVVSKNRQLNCHFEHMLLITAQGVEVLTNYEK